MEKINISFIGDVMLGRDYNGTNTFYEKLKYIHSQNYSEESLKKIYGTTLNLLKNSDLLCGNLETAITNFEEKYPKVFNYRINPIFSKTLKINKNMFLNLANNHILDYQEQGLIDTINTLRHLDIKFAGAGNNIREAIKPAILKIKQFKIGIIGCADHYDYWSADTNKPGIFYIDYKNYDNLLEYIQNLKLMVDLLILSIHWGPNYIYGIKEKYETFANNVLNSGVDIIHGHSSHHVKCVTQKNNKVVIYGMGDFINDYAIDPYYRNDLGMIIKVIIEKNKNVKKYIVPTQISDREVNIIEDNNLKNKVINMVENDCYLRI